MVPDGAVLDIFSSEGADAAGSGLQIALGFVVWLIPYYVLNYIVAPKMGLIEELEPPAEVPKESTKEPWE